MAYSTSVNELVAVANKFYAQKEYEEASLKYGEACETYSTENDKEDADLLNLYGKALFQNAVLKSEVFGGVGSDNQEPKTEEKDENDGNFQFHDDAPLADEDDQQVAAQPAVEEEDAEDEGNKENEPEEEQSDFEVAWEILDLSRSLYELQLEQCSEKPETTPFLTSDGEEPKDQYVVLTKKLSDVYDLLGEVSLESENFSQAAIDLQKSLELRQQLYNPQLSALVSESHYKLSLALEFCVEDPNLRTKAAEQMRLAIKSVERRNENEKSEAKKQDNKELLSELKERLVELQKDPAQEFDEQKMDIIKGILGEASPNDGDAGSKDTKRTAVNDLSGMIKKKKPKK